jgi:hypothetical protein
MWDTEIGARYRLSIRERNACADLRSIPMSRDRLRAGGTCSAPRRSRLHESRRSRFIYFYRYRSASESHWPFEIQTLRYFVTCADSLSSPPRSGAEGRGVRGSASVQNRVGRTKDSLFPPHPDLLPPQAGGEGNLVAATLALRDNATGVSPALAGFPSNAAKAVFNLERSEYGIACPMRLACSSMRCHGSSLVASKPKKTYILPNEPRFSLSQPGKHRQRSS